MPYIKGSYQRRICALAVAEIFLSLCLSWHNRGAVVMVLLAVVTVAYVLSYLAQPTNNMMWLISLLVACNAAAIIVFGRIHGSLLDWTFGSFLHIVIVLAIVTGLVTRASAIMLDWEARVARQLSRYER